MIEQEDINFIILIICCVIIAFVTHWLMTSLRELDEFITIQEAIVDEINEVIPAFGFGATKPNAGSFFHGIVTEAGGSPLLRAPLSGRRCLLYQIKFGYPEPDGSISYEHSIAETGAIPFILEDRTRVILNDQDFQFSSSAVAYRHEFMPESIPSELRERMSILFYPTRRDGKRAWKKGRFYEWILPPDTVCELVGTAHLEPSHYRRPDELLIHNAFIHVGPRGNDQDMLDILRHARIAAIRRIAGLSRRRKFILILGITPIMVSAGIILLLISEYASQHY